MSPKEREILEEERINLKNILDFYVQFRNRILSMKDEEVDAHINDILDRLSEIQKLLEI